MTTPGAPFYNTVLVPVDGSEHSAKACRYAITLAAYGVKSSLILMHCFGQLPPSIGGEDRESVIKLCEKEALAMMKPFIEQCEQSGLEYKTVVRGGSPGKAIVQVSKEERCDLIVMGSRGLGSFSSLIMGSVSLHVLQSVDVPILIVH